MIDRRYTQVFDAFIKKNLFIVWCLLVSKYLSLFSKFYLSHLFSFSFQSISHKNKHFLSYLVACITRVSHKFAMETISSTYEKKYYVWDEGKMLMIRNHKHEITTPLDTVARHIRSRIDQCIKFDVRRLGRDRRRIWLLYY